MKATLEFDLDNELERMKFNRTIAIDELCYYILRFEELLRSKDKYGPEKTVNIEQLRNEIHQLKTDAVHFAMENY